MALRKQKVYGGKQSPNWRQVLAIVTVLLLSCGATIWILNIQDIIHGPWSNVVAVIFSLLGVLFTFLQWLLPFSPSESESSAITSVNKPRIAEEFIPKETKTSLPPYVNKLNHDSIHEHIESIAAALGVNKERGAIVVYTNEQTHTNPIDICTSSSLHARHWSSVAYRHVVNDYIVWAAFFERLKPGNYIVYYRSYERLEKVTVHAEKVTEVDWRVKQENIH